jgi:ATP-binding cassette subfamily B protein
MDYEIMEAPDFKAVEEKAEKATQSNAAPGCNLLREFAKLLTNIFGFLLYGSVISMIHPLVLVLLVVSAIINWVVLSMARRYEESTKDARAATNGRLLYLGDCFRASENGGKDIRMYSMFDWLRDLEIFNMREKTRADGKVGGAYMRSRLVDGFLILIRDGAAYAFLIWLLLADRLSLGDFVLMFAAIGTFAGWVSGIIKQYADLSRASSQTADCRAYIEYPDKSNTGEGVPLPEDVPAIKLENVAYRYPDADALTLAGISIDIKAGERIAVVGVNGAGKTTLVKLICGLYQPTEGHVTLGGNDAAAYNRDEYFSLMAAVFQDIYLLPTSIAGNISQQPQSQIDYPRVEYCLKLAGLFDKVQTLPEKADTLLVKAVNDDAIELSGGEKQKLALARAIYKNAPVIILDEPTAALDPIAENETYQKYAELTEGKTSIYISHRLASTRFCDRILFIDDHKIAEEGTHDELMKRGGKYAEMFAIQASYYEEG